MVERTKRLLLLLWKMTFPLLVYLSIVDLVFAAWGIAAGRIGENQVLPLTAFAAALALLPLGSEYRMARRRQGHNSHSNKADRRLGGKSLLWISLTGAGACLFFNSLLKVLPLPAEGYQQASRTLYGPVFVIQLISIGVVIPMAEELVFRGLGYYRLRQDLSARTAAILTACCFALFHGNLVQGIYAALFGLFLAMLYEIYDSLWACWLFHGMANLVSIILTRILLKGGRKNDVRWMMGTMIVGGALFIAAGNKIRKEGKNLEIINHSHTLL